MITRTSAVHIEISPTPISTIALNPHGGLEELLYFTGKTRSSNSLWVSVSACLVPQGVLDCNLTMYSPIEESMHTSAKRFKIQSLAPLVCFLFAEFV